MIKELKEFYKDKKVLISGHTGFCGSWLTLWLIEMGAKVIGVSNDVPSERGIFTLAKLHNKIIDNEADVTDYNLLKHIFHVNKPDIVFHLAAQALVRTSYDEPQETFNTNVIGTVNVLECIRTSPCVKAAVMITTDKVYKNKEWMWGYRENDQLGGHDPYSSSKTCAELAIKCYRDAFNLNIASARAGNVIGGGDWAKNRIVPDIMKAIENDEPIKIRNPLATRPWQFVLEPLYGYLILGKKLYEGGHKYCGSYNFGPDTDMAVMNVDTLATNIKNRMGKGIIHYVGNEGDVKETNFLALDCTKAKKELGWESSLGLNLTLSLVCEWYAYYKCKDIYDLCTTQIRAFEELAQ